MTNLDTAVAIARRPAPTADCGWHQGTTLAAARRPLTEQEEEQRRLHINDKFSLRRRGDRIIATLGTYAGTANVELSVEEARRASDALSLFAGIASAVDVEIEELGRVA